MKRIVVVQDGPFSEESRSLYAQTLKQSIESVKITPLGGQEPEPVATVTVVPTCSEAEYLVQDGGIYMVIFITSLQLKVARSFLRTYPPLKVVVLTEIVPPDEVLIIPQNSLTGASFLLDT